MWVVNGNDIKMTEGDFGVELPITIRGTTLTASDSVGVTIKSKLNGEVVLTKSFSSITDNTVNLSFTEEESGLLKVGAYIYSLDWYQSGVFLCNIIPRSVFEVVEKA